jgi:N-acetylmuramoyl-L-alanine amidase
MKPLYPEAIKMLVVHCSDTPDDTPLRAPDIQQMHLGFGWDGIGYHYVIGRDGKCEAGRPEYWQGAHVKGVNDQSLGVCLIGRTHFTAAQLTCLETLLRQWQMRYPGAVILGHRDAADTPKTCPNFDVAAWWQDRMNTPANTHVTPVTGAVALSAQPMDGLPLETEVLFGETAEVLSQQNGFMQVRLVTDNYEGWVPSTGVTGVLGTGALETGTATPPPMRITAASVFVTRDADVKSPALLRLSMGALVSVVEHGPDWLEIILPQELHEERDEVLHGFVPANAVCSIDHYASDYVSIAETLLNAPYLWGGRTSAGLDCSALVQLALQAVGTASPRNSGAQLSWAKARGRVVEQTELQRGDLMFWPGHVAICQSTSHMLHANAFHHAVASERLIEALPRLKAATNQPVLAVRLKLS